MNELIKRYVYFTYVVQAMNVAVNFIYSLIIIRQLGASGYGEYALFYNSLVFAILLLGFNLPSIVVFFIANRKIDAARLLYSCFSLIIALSIGLAFLLYQSGTLGLAIHIFPGGNNKVLWIFFFVLQFLLLQVNQVLAAFLNANKIFIPVAVFSLGSNIALLLFWILFTFGAIRFSGSLFNLVWWVSTAVNACVMIYYLYLVYSKVLFRSSWKLIGRRELKVIAGFAAMVYVCNTLQFLNYKMDIWFVNYYHGERDTGVYALALSLSQLIWILPNAISSVLLNYFEVAQRENSILLAQRYGRLTIYLSLLTAILLAGGYYFALPYVYGDQFYSSFRICLILFAGTIPFSLSIILANLNSGIGFIRINFYAALFTFLLGLVLDIVLVPRYGIDGAAVAKVIIYCVGLIFQFVVGRILYNLQWISLFAFPRLKRADRTGEGVPD